MEKCNNYVIIDDEETDLFFLKKCYFTCPVSYDNEVMKNATEMGKIKYNNQEIKNEMLKIFRQKNTVKWENDENFKEIMLEDFI